MKRGGISGISRERPVLIAGPTASGKSTLAMEIAARDGRVIVNADALQVYGCWRLLTARPDAGDEARVPHLLYGHVGREQPYSVGHWLRELRAVLARHPTAVIVGGTGLYFSALTEGLADIPPTPPETRATSASCTITLPPTARPKAPTTMPTRMAWPTRTTMKAMPTTSTMPTWPPPMRAAGSCSRRC